MLMKLPVLWSSPPRLGRRRPSARDDSSVLRDGDGELWPEGRQSGRPDPGAYLVNAGLLAGQSYYQMIVG